MNELIPLIFFFIFVIGTAFGSFANVLIDRLTVEETKESIGGRSHCDYCRHRLAWYDLVPVLSFVTLGGKCRYCGRRLSLQYPVLEIACGVLFLAVTAVYFWKTEHIWSIASWLRLGLIFGIATGLHVVFFADIKYQLIPDEVQAAIAILGGMWTLSFVRSWQDLGWILVAVLVVTAPILALYLLTRGKGMGFGDVKLAANIGLLMGTKNGLLSLYFGFITGAIVGIFVMMIGKKGMKSKIAFGPFLIAGMVITILFQTEIDAFLRAFYGLH